MQQQLQRTVIKEKDLLAIESVAALVKALKKTKAIKHLTDLKDRSVEQISALLPKEKTTGKGAKKNNSVRFYGPGTQSKHFPALVVLCQAGYLKQPSDKQSRRAERRTPLSSASFGSSSGAFRRESEEVAAFRKHRELEAARTLRASIDAIRGGAGYDPSNGFGDKSEDAQALREYAEREAVNRFQSSLPQHYYNDDR